MSEEAVGAFVTRCALDTLPRTRRKVLEVLANGGEHSVREVAAAAGRIDRKVARRCLEDLRALDLAVCPTVDGYEDDGGDGESLSTIARDWQLRRGHFGELAARVIAAQRAAGGEPMWSK
jgi:predicted ArsR family transcriptional regulator